MASTIHYGELNELIIERQVELFGVERVSQAMEKGGLEPGMGSSLLPDDSEDSERVFRRLLLAFGRHLGFLSLTATKSALVKYCMENDLPTERYLKSLLS